jgi:hypothetical protein
MFLVAIFLLINFLEYLFEKIIGIFKKYTNIIINGLFRTDLKERLGAWIDIINN